jgi:Putative beta barrel porin-7 (BBP7)
MQTHLKWIRVTAAAAVVAGVGMQAARAQYAPYQPVAQTPAAAPTTAAQTTPYSPYTYMAYRPQPQYQAPATVYPQTSAPAYGAAGAAQDAQPTSAYPQYPQTAAQYPNTYGANPYVAQQPTAELPAPKQPSTSAAKAPGSSAPSSAATTGSTSAAQGMSAGQAGCGCNGSAPNAGGDYYNYSAGACGCNGPATNDYGIRNYFGDSCSESQWFGGVYFLEMGRTNASPVKFTVGVDTSASAPYYPTAADTVLTNRDANFDFREGLEVRLGSTFTIGEHCSACETGCNSYGYGYGGCGCGRCAPTIYAWEVAWWGINSDDQQQTVVYQPSAPVRLYGMTNFVGLQYDSDGDGNSDGAVNTYYGYGLPITPGAPNDGDIVVLAQRVHTDFQAQNLELNIVRFPVCNTCAGGCNGGCNGGCDAGGNNCGCDNGCRDLGFTMYGSCGVRYFHVRDDLSYCDAFGVYDGNTQTYDYTFNGFTYDDLHQLVYDVEVKNDLVGPQVGWTTDYCWGKWNLFLNSTFGIFDNHMTATQQMWSGGGGTVTFAGDGSTFNVKTHKDAVAFLGELRTGVAYDLTCHWRAVAAYRAVAITGLATASDQIPTDFTNKESVGIINSDSSAIIHGVQVGAECRY